MHGSGRFGTHESRSLSVHSAMYAAARQRTADVAHEDDATVACQARGGLKMLITDMQPVRDA